MSYFFRARRAGVTMSVLMLSIVLIATLSGLQVPTLNLLGGGKSYVPVSVLLPLIGVAALMSFLTSVPAEMEMTAVRPVRRYEATVITGSIALVIGIGALLTFSGFHVHAFAAARNLTGYLGLAIVGQKLLGRHAAIILPVIFAFVCMTAGRRPGGYPWPWAWPLFESRHVPALVIATACCLTGLLLLASAVRPIRRPKDAP
ncbi:hypothetical protein [Microbispora sp. NBC_01389]|uniref:hypothetical protein n=1 Tax=Microbispora sp. NBC_01389 TaxID=2903584 RepID=UPI003243687C